MRKDTIRIRFFTLVALTLTLGLGAAHTASATIIVDDTWTTGPPPPNDCSGVFGQGFEECVFNESPIIAKFNTGETPPLDGWEFNSSDFPSIDGTEWIFAPNNPPTGSETSGSWSYVAGTDDPDIRYWVAKGGSQGFLLFFDVTSPTQGCIDNPSTCYNQANAVTSGTYSVPSSAGLSHISFYDTGPLGPPGQVPEPGILALFGLALLGVGAAGLQRRQRESIDA